MKYLVSLRNLDISANLIRNLKELDNVKSLDHLTCLDLSYNHCQKIKFYKIVMVYKLPQIRTLDGVDITPEDYVKAEIFYGQEVEQKKQIFKSILPEEEFIDRRIFTSHMLDPDSDTEPAEYDFFDKYGEDGKKIDNPPSYLPKGRTYPFGTGRGIDPPNTTIDLDFVAASVEYMKEQIDNYLKENKNETLKETMNAHFDATNTS